MSEERFEIGSFRNLRTNGGEGGNRASETLQQCKKPIAGNICGYIWQEFEGALNHSQRAPASLPEPLT
jgi:hypothetical protein